MEFADSTRHHFDILGWSTPTGAVCLQDARTINRFFVRGWQQNQTTAGVLSDCLTMPEC